MRSALSVLTVAVAALALPASSQAQLTLTNPLHSCEYMMALSAFDPDAAECLGAYEGNNDGSPTHEAAVLQMLADAGWGDLTDLGTTQMDGDDAEGYLTFSPSLTGDYVIALKSNDFVSFYRFLGLSDQAQVWYTTQGVSLNQRERAQGLSHYTLYGAPTVTVPEPESAALLLTGLFALGFVAARRRRDQVA
jgi:hypothetical protein